MTGVKVGLQALERQDSSSSSSSFSSDEHSDGVDQFGSEVFFPRTSSVDIEAPRAEERKDVTTLSRLHSTPLA